MPEEIANCKKLTIDLEGNLIDDQNEAEGSK